MGVGLAWFCIPTYEYHTLVIRAVPIRAAFVREEERKMWLGG